MCPIDKVAEDTFKVQLPGIVHKNLESGGLLLLGDDELHFLDGAVTDAVVVE